MTRAGTPAGSPEPDAADELERPFPLERGYRRRVLPIVALFVISTVALTGLAVRQVVRDINLDFAARRVAEISSEARGKMPEAWDALIAGKADAGQRTALSALFADAVAERSLSQMKIYAPSGEALFSTDPAEIGTREDNAALSSAIHERERVLTPRREADGRDYNELYIPVSRPDGSLGLVMELYEPAGYLSAILWRALVLPMLVPGLILAGLLIVLGILIRRAQRGIDRRAAAVRALSARLQSFVSSSAVGAVRGAAGGGEVPLRRIDVTLLFSDVRGFTDFAESADPAAVVAFLDRVMTLQIACVARHGGDVDKLIGDAVLARFEGEGKERRAVAAALDIQAEAARADLPRGLGVGVFTGPAILGPIGPPARRDFTVVGDSVNTASRLSAAAGSGEIVADAETLAESGTAARFGPAEAIRPKGREQAVQARRWRRGAEEPA